MLLLLSFDQRGRGYGQTADSSLPNEALYFCSVFAVRYCRVHLTQDHSILVRFSSLKSSLLNLKGKDTVA